MLSPHKFLTIPSGCCMVLIHEMEHSNLHESQCLNVSMLSDAQKDTLAKLVDKILHKIPPELTGHASHGSRIFHTFDCQGVV